jgi:uncharacterized protein (DUF433 family)
MRSRLVWADAQWGYVPQLKGCRINVMAALDRITFDPTRMNGQACIRDLRLTVRRVVEALAVYPDRAELKREYPELEDEDIRQALAYAAANLEDEALDLPASR